MTIEKMTEDAQAAALAESRAECSRMRQERSLLEDRRSVAVAQRDQSRAECERLREELAGKAGYNVWMRAAKELGAKLDAAESKLAAANVLLVEALPESVCKADWLVRRDAHFVACGYDPTSAPPSRGRGALEKGSL
jgi:hypothetical protein